MRRERGRLYRPGAELGACCCGPQTHSGALVSNFEFGRVWAGDLGQPIWEFQKLCRPHVSISMQRGQSVHVATASRPFLRRLQKAAFSIYDPRPYLSRASWWAA